MGQLEVPTGGQNLAIIRFTNNYIPPVPSPFLIELLPSIRTRRPTCTNDMDAATGPKKSGESARGCRRQLRVEPVRPLLTERMAAFGGLR